MCELILQILGSVANDLMWAIYPFVEANKDKKFLFNEAVKHYFDQIKVVLESFNKKLEDYNIPDDITEFQKIVKRGIVLEFMNVTVLR